MSYVCAPGHLGGPNKPKRSIEKGQTNGRLKLPKNFCRVYRESAGRWRHPEGAGARCEAFGLNFDTSQTREWHLKVENMGLVMHGHEATYKQDIRVICYRFQSDFFVKIHNGLAETELG